jgi:hypothetical protein
MADVLLGDEEEGKPLIQGVGVQVAVVLDCTGSMSSEIDACKDNLVALVDQIKQQVMDQCGQQCVVEVGYVGYKEPGDEGHLDFMNLPTDVDAVTSLLASQNASGGGDLPEEIAAAFEKAASMSWKQNMTMMCILVADAPCHGK